METPEILGRFHRPCHLGFQKEAAEAAVARKDEVTPGLLRILEDTLEHPESVDPDSVAPLYALFLLAQFREVRAYPLAVRFAMLPDEVSDPLLGDFVTAGLGRVLASVCGGDAGGIQSVIESEQASEWSRGAAVRSLVTLVAAGVRSREEVLTYFAELYRGKLERSYSHVWDELTSCCADLGGRELLADVKRAFGEGLVDEGYIGLDEFLSSGSVLDTGQTESLVDDTITEFGWWACFHPAR